MRPTLSNAREHTYYKRSEHRNRTSLNVANFRKRSPAFSYGLSSGSIAKTSF